MMIRWWCLGIQKKRNLLRQVYRRITCAVNSFYAVRGPRSGEERDSMGDRQLFVHSALRARSWGVQREPNHRSNRVNQSRNTRSKWLQSQPEIETYIPFDMMTNVQNGLCIRVEFNYAVNSTDQQRRSTTWISCC